MFSMKKMFLAIFLFAAFTYSAECDSLRKGFTNIYCGNYKIKSMDELSNILSSCPAANEAFQGASGLSRAASILMTIGGGCIGYNLGVSIVHGALEPIDALWYVGGGCIAVGIPIAIISSGKTSRAIRLYNSCNKNDNRSSLRIDLDISALSLLVSF
jgi:hypothetical protein